MIGTSVREIEFKLNQLNPLTVTGKITKVVGTVVEAVGIKAAIGDICEIFAEDKKVKAEVIGFSNSHILLMPFEGTEGILPESRIVHLKKQATIGVSDQILGRVIDGLGQPLDGKGEIEVEKEYLLYGNPSNPLSRIPIDEPIDVGVRAINGLITIGKGQRMGIFSGSGVGKTTLLGMMVRNAKADVKVVALIGARGREVRDFIERHVRDAISTSVLVVATSDQSPLIRMRGAFVATAIAEYFRDKGMDVLLIMDSVTRFAMAKRELGLAGGELPATKGYTPSVFATLPKLLERAGRWEKGSITGFYTVLVEGDDMNDPIADAVRSILDGHIILSRDLARQNQYPPIDVLNSISRIMIDITSMEHHKLANRFRDVLATYEKAEDLINIGAYSKGSNPKIEYAIKMIDRLREFLKQGIFEYISLEQSTKELKELFNE